MNVGQITYLLSAEWPMLSAADSARLSAPETANEQRPHEALGNVSPTPYLMAKSR
jgi:hypothetical protein